LLFYALILGILVAIIHPQIHNTKYQGDYSVQIVAVKDLEVGMTVEKTVQVRGMILLASGATLNSSHIQCLKRWNISGIYIKNNTKETKNKKNEQKIEIQKIAQRFTHYTDNSQMLLLKSALIQELAEETNG